MPLNIKKVNRKIRQKMITQVTICSLSQLWQHSPSTLQSRPADNMPIVAAYFATNKETG